MVHDRRGGIVRIDGRPYVWAVEPPADDPAVSVCVAVYKHGQWWAGNDGRFHYHVTAFAAGWVECDCWDAIVRHNGQRSVCKHAAALAAAGVITLSPEVYG